MGNPIFDIPNSNQQQAQPTGLFGMLSQIRNSPDPNAAMQQMINTNPQLQNIMNYIQANGGDARTAFYNLAAQKGINPNNILNQLK